MQALSSEGAQQISADLRSASERIANGQHVDFAKSVFESSATSSLASKDQLDWLWDPYLLKSDLINLCPPLVSDFVSELVTTMGPSDVSGLLDPCVGVGTLLHPVVRKVQPTKFLGLGSCLGNPEDLLDQTHKGVMGDVVALTSLLSPSRDAGDYRVSDYDLGALESNEQFDVVVGLNTPGVLDVRLDSRSWFKVKRKRFNDLRCNELLLRASLRLRPSGICAFVVNPRFFERDSSLVAGQLEDFDLFIDAAFLLPAGTFRPVTTSPSYVAVIRKGTADGPMFVAKVTEGRQGMVLKNYLNQTEAKQTEDGAFVDVAEFLGLPQLVESKKLEKRLQRQGFPIRRLSEICESMDLFAVSSDVQEDPESLVFFSLDKHTCSHAEEDLSASGKWVRLKVNEELADPKVLLGYLEGPYGQAAAKCRMAPWSDSLPITELGEFPVCLPDLAHQRSIIELDNQLSDLGKEVADLRADLWGAPQAINDVESKIQRINTDDSFERWLDRLPFPLSSILWTYHIRRDDPRGAIERLDFFFEALAELLAVLMISVVRRDKPFFEKPWSVVTARLRQMRLSLERATSGTWIAIFEGLAKSVRGNMDQHGATEYWLQKFACDEGELLKQLLSKRMIGVLRTGNSYRNKWRGHGGVVSDDEARERQRAYERLLRDFRSLVEDRWERYPMVLAGNSKYSDGVYDYSAEVVMGTRTPFNTMRMSMREPMEHRQLHFVSLESGVACPLIPFIRLGTSENQETGCYFFNRLERDGQQRYVSYHFVQQAEMLDVLPKVRAVLEELSAPKFS